jgi:hypothetical protein
MPSEKQTEKPVMPLILGSIAAKNNVKKAAWNAMPAIK